MLVNRILLSRDAKSCQLFILAVRASRLRATGQGYRDQLKKFKFFLYM